MPVRGLTALLAACVLLIATPSQASTYPGEHPWTGPLADAVYTTADSYWSARGLPGARPTILVATSLCDIDGCSTTERGSAAQYTIWLHASRITKDPVALCYFATHGLGHARGLGHSQDPRDVMYEGWQSYPAECIAAFGPDLSSVSCQPGWSRATTRTRRLWRHKRRHAARREFRHWAKRHPIGAERARTVGVVCQ